MFEIVREDLRRACAGNQYGATDFGAHVRELFNPGTQAIVIHRFGYWADHLRFAPLRAVLRIVHFLVQSAVSWRVGIFIPIKAEIGPGMMIHTWGGGVFLPCARIGKNLTIIGGGILFDYDTYSIGDDCVLGAGTKGVGRLRIGNRVRTGPNSVVQEDVPDDCLVFGNPGRIVRQLSGFRRAKAAGASSNGAAADARVAPVKAGAGAPSVAAAVAVHS